MKENSVMFANSGSKSACSKSLLLRAVSHANGSVVVHGSEIMVSLGTERADFLIAFMWKPRSSLEVLRRGPAAHHICLESE